MKNLEEIIKSKIREQGPITFAEFTELALYHPTYGYYSSERGKIGKEGDFYTSPHVHRAFGSVIGNFILKAFDLLDREDLSIVEVGASKGLLALDILNHLKRENSDYYKRTTYHVVENSQYARTESKELLREHADAVKWHSSLSEIEEKVISGVVISNELFDALPFHRLKYTNGSLNEIFVTLSDNEIFETIDKVSNPELQDYFHGLDIDFTEDQELEVNLLADLTVKEIDRILNKGFVISIDYGFLNNELFSPARMKGTYKCIHKHEINEMPYINIGEQDITAHVDFSNLIRAGESLNLNTLKYTTQGQFLVDWGILELVDKDSEENEKLSDLSAKDIRAIKNLFLPELMGDKFKVLIQEKNMSEMINSFYPPSPFKISFKVL